MTQKVLILGVTGMLGHTLFKKINIDKEYNVKGTVRSIKNLSKWTTSKERKKIIPGIDAAKFASVSDLIAKEKPNIVINCIGIVKQLPIAKAPVPTIRINALFPHQLAEACEPYNMRLIHISTDCVFSGKTGFYKEQDPSDAEDLYGRTKYLGEVNSANCITLRTSIIGHELNAKLGLIEWFLTQKDNVKGFTQAIYSGFPTIELARIITDFVIPNDDLSGLYHVSSDPISKYDLLNLVAAIYKKDIIIEPYNQFVCDRSLDSTKFRNTTGYNPPGWTELVENMYSDYIEATT